MIKIIGQGKAKSGIKVTEGGLRPPYKKGARRPLAVETVIQGYPNVPLSASFLRRFK